MLDTCRPIHRGATLMEMLVSIVIASLLMVAVTAMLLASMRVWARSSSQSLAYPMAQGALARINRDLLNAAYVVMPMEWTAGLNYAVGASVIRADVTYRCTVAHLASDTKVPGTAGGASYWAVTAPWILLYRAKIDHEDAAREAARIVQVPLEADLTGVKRYYLSDATGASHVVGTTLWVKTFTQLPNQTITAVTTKRVAANVTALIFTNDAIIEDGQSVRLLAVNSIAIAVQRKVDQQQAASTFTMHTCFRNPSLAVPPPMPLIP